MFPVHQWVLSLPFPVRFLIANKPALINAVLAVFIRVIFGWMRSKAGQPDGQCGAVTFLWSAHRTRSVTVIADR